jgi:hypothetical protein
MFIYVFLVHRRPLLCPYAITRPIPQQDQPSICPHCNDHMCHRTCMWRPLFDHPCLLPFLCYLETGYLCSHAYFRFDFSLQAFLTIFVIDWYECVLQREKYIVIGYVSLLYLNLVYFLLYLARAVIMYFLQPFIEDRDGKHFKYSCNFRLMYIYHHCSCFCNYMKVQFNKNNGKVRLYFTL